MTLPVQHHTCSHPVCGRYKDTATERDRYLSVHRHGRFQMSELCKGAFWGLNYLAGVSHAGLRDVTVVYSVTARHPSQLVLSQTTTEEDRGKNRKRHLRAAQVRV